MEHVKKFDEFKKFATSPKTPENMFEPSDEYCIFDETRKSFDISSISKQDLKDAYINFKLFKNRPHGTHLVECFKQRRLNEGVNKSLSIEDVKSSLFDKYPLREWQFRIFDGANDITVLMIAPNVDDNVDMIVEDMFSMGYYRVFTEYERDGEGNVWAYMRFDPKYTKDLTGEVKRFEKLYHFSPKYNLESIKEHGFVPMHKHSRFDYPPRVHFIKGDTSEDVMMRICTELCEDNHDPKNDGCYVRFEIGVSKIPDDVKFFGDSCLECGVCTYDPIPYDVVTEVEEFIYNGSSKK